MRLKLGEVQLDQLVILCSLIFLEFGSIFAGKVSDVLALGSLEIIIHSIVEGENRCCCTNFSTLLSDVSVDAEWAGRRRKITILEIVAMPVALTLLTPGPVVVIC